MATTLGTIATDAAPLITALGPTLIQGIIQLFQAAHPVAPTADQATKDAANAAKAAGALQTTTTLATQLAPALTSSMDPNQLASILSGAIETLYQQMKGNGTLNAPASPAVAPVAKPGPSTTGQTTPVVISVATLSGSLTMTGTMRTPQ